MKPMVYTTPVRTALSPDVIRPVMYEILELFVDCLANNCLSALEQAVWAAARITREVVTKAVQTMLIVFAIIASQLTSDTQCTSSVFGAIYFSDVTLTEF